MLSPPARPAKEVFDRLQLIFEGDPTCHLFYVDCGYGVLDWFRDKSRATNVGIAEQNAVDMAIGVSLNGLRPWVYSHAAFLIFRAFESLRVLARTPHACVKLIGGGAGDHFAHLSSLHVTGEEDLLACDSIGLPVYNCVGMKFDPAIVDAFMTDRFSGYLRL